MKGTLSIILLSLFVNYAICGSYLFFMPFSSKSSKIAFMPLAEELASRGHSITIVSPIKPKKPVAGITEIINESKFEELTTYVSNQNIVNSTGDLPIFQLLTIAEETNENGLSHPEIQSLISSRKTFDVVVVMPVFTCEAGYVLASKFNSSLVLFFSGMSSVPFGNWATGSPHNPAYMPLVVLPFTSNMNFVERFVNTVATAALSFILKDWFMLPGAQRVVKKVFPQDPVVDLKKLESTASLFINLGNPFFADGLRPVNPNQILAGFMGCQPADKLPKDLQDWIDGAEHGVIYVSFGTVVKAEVMPDIKRDAFITVLASLKQRVIWKWDGPLPNKPKNVLTSPWLPQKDILANKNVRLFVTHGGAGGLQETICHKTPMLGIPIVADQISNLFLAEAKGIAKVVQWKDVDEATLGDGIRTVLEDGSYQDGINELGDLVLDQPVHPLERAAWWMEYLLRHPGNTAMRSPVHDLAWYQYFLLDVVVVIVAGVVAVGMVVKALVGCCWRRVGRQKLKKQ